MPPTILLVCPPSIIAIVYITIHGYHSDIIMLPPHHPLPFALSSSHLQIFVSIKVIHRRCFKSTDYVGSNEHLSSTDWVLLLSSFLANEAIDIMYFHLNSAIEFFASSVPSIISFNRSCFSCKPVILIGQKRIAHRHFKNFNFFSVCLVLFNLKPECKIISLNC
jgi:hypothetical protein